MTTRCHSVFSFRSPDDLSRQVSDVATLSWTIGRPSWVRRTSGSLPRLPTRITLLTLPAIVLSTFTGCRLRRPYTPAAPARRDHSGVIPIYSTPSRLCSTIVLTPQRNYVRQRAFGGWPRATQQSSRS